MFYRSAFGQAANSTGSVMDQFLLVMTVLVCSAMIGVMTRLTFYDHRYGAAPAELDAIRKLLAQFDEMDAYVEPTLLAA